MGCLPVLLLFPLGAGVGYLVGGDVGALWGAGIGVVLGAIIMVIGYTLGSAFVYSTPEYAIIKLPFEILQAGIGAVMGMVLCFSRNLAQRFEKICA